MNKKVLFFVFVFWFGFSYSQNTIKEVYENLKNGNLEEAKKGIDFLSEKQENTNNPAIWYYRGVVYHSIYENKDPKIRALSSEALLEAYNSYLKTIKFDEKKEYFNDVTNRLEVAAISFYNKGVDEFSNKNYIKAFDAFECAVNINEMPMINKVDTVIYLNAAISAENAGKTDKAEFYYKKMIDLNFGGVKTYVNLAEIYQNNGNEDQYVNLLKNGISKYPNDNEKLLVKLINFYMSKGLKDKALDYLEMAIKNDPGNSMYYFVKGSIFDQLEDFDKAIINYQKAIEINNQYFDANYNLGVIYFNRGIDHIKIAEENMNQSKVYDGEKAKAENEFKRALPYLEVAIKIKPEDRNTLQTLLVIYNRLQMKEEFEKIKTYFDE